MKRNKPLHIGLISRYYPPDPGGGLAIYTQHIAREFVKQGHQVTVIAATPNNKSVIEDDNGVLIIRVPQLKVFKRSLIGATCLWNSYKITKTILNIQQQSPLDVIQCPATFYESLIFGRYYKSGLKIPLVIKFHENRETYERIEGYFKKLKTYRRNWLKGLLKQAAYNADYWLGVSKNSLYSSIQYLNLPLHLHPYDISPSPVDINLFKQVYPPDSEYFRRFGLTNQSQFLLYSGRLIHEKGLHLLVEAFLSEISKRFPSLYLVIAGEYDYRQPYYEQSIRNYIYGHPAASRVIFAGYIPYNEMPYWFSQAQLFVAPSFCEPFGRIYIEAMACKTPVIGFNAGGPKEFIIHGENGYLINQQTSEALANGVCTVLENPSLQKELQFKGHQTVLKHFGTENIALNLIELYANLSCKFTSQRLFYSSKPKIG